MTLFCRVDKSIETKQLPSPEDRCSVCRTTEKLIGVTVQLYDVWKCYLLSFYKEPSAILYALTQSEAEAGLKREIFYRTFFRLGPYYNSRPIQYRDFSKPPLKVS